MNTFLLQLEFQGIVLFDPFNLDRFCKENNIRSPDILDYFIQNPIIGDIALQKGIIIPVYTIIPEDYKIIVSDYSEPDESDLFSYKPFPLQTIGNRLIIADIYSIIDWDPGFYTQPDTGKIQFTTQQAIPIDSGNYSVNISGFYKDSTEFGYRFDLTRVETLPVIDLSNDIDTYDFNVVKDESRTKRL